MRAVDVERVVARHREEFREHALAVCLYKMGFPADDTPAVIEAVLCHMETCAGGEILLDALAEQAVGMFIEGLLVGIELGRADR